MGIYWKSIQVLEGRELEVKVPSAHQTQCSCLEATSEKSWKGNLQWKQTEKSVLNMIHAACSKVAMHTYLSLFLGRSKIAFLFKKAIGS